MPGRTPYVDNKSLANASNSEFVAMSQYLNSDAKGWVSCLTDIYLQETAKT